MDRNYDFNLCRKGGVERPDLQWYLHTRDSDRNRAKSDYSHAQTRFQL